MISHPPYSIAKLTCAGQRKTDQQNTDATGAGAQQQSDSSSDESASASGETSGNEQKSQDNEASQGGSTYEDVAGWLNQPGCF